MGYLLLDCGDLTEATPTSSDGPALVLGEQGGKDGGDTLPALELRVRRQDQGVEQGVGLVAAGGPDGRDGEGSQGNRILIQSIVRIAAKKRCR